MPRPPTLPVLSKMKRVDLINAIRMVSPYNTIMLPSRANEPDDNDDNPSLSTTHFATLSDDGNAMEVEEANDMEAEEDKADEVDKGELYHQEDDNADVDTAAYNEFMDVALLEVATEEAAKTASLEAEKAKLATYAEHSALSTPFLSSAPTQSSISVESFLAQYNVGVGLAWAHRPASS